MHSEIPYDILLEHNTWWIFPAFIIRIQSRRKWFYDWLKFETRRISLFLCKTYAFWFRLTSLLCTSKIAVIREIVAVYAIRALASGEIIWFLVSAKVASNMFTPWHTPSIVSKFEEFYVIRSYYDCKKLIACNTKLHLHIYIKVIKRMKTIKAPSQYLIKSTQW